MPSRDHMLGYPAVLDAINPLPLKKPPLGRIPERFRPPVVVAPGPMCPSDMRVLPVKPAYSYALTLLLESVQQRDRAMQLCRAYGGGQRLLDLWK